MRKTRQSRPTEEDPDDVPLRSSRGRKLPAALTENPLVLQLSNKLADELGGPPYKYRSIVSSSLSELPSHIVEDYCASDDDSDEDEFTPKKTFLWTKDLDKVTIKRLQPQMDQIDQLEAERTPTVPKILDSNLSLDQKAHAINLLKILQTTDVSPEYYKLRDEINQLLASQTSEEEALIGSVAAVDPIEDLKRRLFALEADNYVKSRILARIMKLTRLSSDDAEYRDTREWIMAALELPYNHQVAIPIVDKSNAGINAFCSAVYEKLEADIFGMQNIKQQIIQMLNNRITNPKTTGCSFGIIGGVGVGKTTVARSFAKSMGVPCEVISVGGMEDSNIFKGSASHYVGSSASLILKIMAKMKCNNGVIVFDEIDKIAGTHHGQQVLSALLHITDFSSNHQFQDSYLSDFSHDLSNLWFVFTVNSEETLPEALRDRMRPIIRVNPYSVEEKTIIIQKYVLPKILVNVGMAAHDVVFTAAGMAEFLRQMAPLIELSGIRPAKKEIEKLVSRINFLRTNTLADGTLGSLRVSYFLPKFKLPLSLNGEAVRRLMAN